jgi:UMF1 family MFS transporter
VHDPIRGQALLGYAHIVSGVAIAVLSPLLGAVADASGPRKPWIAVFSMLLCAGSAALWFATPQANPSTVFMIMGLIALTALSYELTAVFHAAMLPDLAPRTRIGALSGLGLSLGNAGGVVLLIFVLALVIRFGPASARMAGPLVALWLVLFAAPLMLFTPDSASRGLSLRQALSQGTAQLMGTLGALQQYRNVARYLLARMIYTDGITGILIFSGVYASGTFGWQSGTLAVFGILLSGFGFFGALIGGWIDDRFGSKKAVEIAIASTILSISFAIVQSPQRLFGLIPYDPSKDMVLPLPMFSTLPEALYLLLAIVVAMSISAVFASSRSFLARLAPRERIVQFFGLYALSGTATTWASPLLIGLATDYFHDQRIGFTTTILLLCIGFALLRKVEDARI